MKKFNLFFVLLLSTNFLHAQFDWAIQSSGENSALVGDLALDDQDNFYVLGNTNLNAQFDNITIDDNRTHNYIAKYDSEGVLLWLRPINGHSSNDAWTVGVDNSGDAFIGGQFRQTNTASILDFGTIQVEGDANDNGYIAKIDSDGNWLWAKGILVDGIINILGVGILPDGGALYSGYVSGAVTIDGQTFQTDENVQTLFLAKFDTHGNLEWFKNGTGSFGVGTFGFAPFYKYEMDSDGNSYLMCRIGPGAEYQGNILSQNTSNTFVTASFDTNGDIRWWKTISSSGSEMVLGGLTIDDEDNIYVAAFINGLEIFVDDDPYTEAFFNQWFFKFNNNGEVLKVDAVGSTRVLDLTYHPDGHIIMSGFYEPIWANSFAQYVEGDTLGGGGAIGTYIAGFDKNLNYKGLYQIAFPDGNQSGEIQPRELETNSSGKVYMTGFFQEDIDLGNHTINSDFYDYMFVTKFDPTVMIDFTAVGNQEINDVAFSLYPNPTNDGLWVKREEHSLSSVFIYNQFGILIRKGNIIGRADFIDLSALANGVYFLEVEGFVRKVILE